jgi:hypothetical protein
MLDKPVYRRDAAALEAHTHILFALVRTLEPLAAVLSERRGALMRVALATGLAEVSWTA